jgi:hypothetical protein
LKQKNVELQFSSQCIKLQHQPISRRPLSVLLDATVCFEGPQHLAREKVLVQSGRIWVECVA